MSAVQCKLSGHLIIAKRLSLTQLPRGNRDSLFGSTLLPLLQNSELRLGSVERFQCVNHGRIFAKEECASVFVEIIQHERPRRPNGDVPQET